MGAVKKDCPPTFQLTDQVATIVEKNVRDVFLSMFNLEAETGKPRFEQDHVNQGDVSGTVGMVQEEMEGTLTVSFPKRTIFNILGQIYGREFTTVDQSVKEGVGELTNVIYSMIKRGLNDTGYAFKMAIPDIIVGDNHQIFKIQTGPTLVLPFVLSGEAFEVSITIRSGVTPSRRH